MEYLRTNNIFKLESYITPIILSYLSKYVKNLDTEVSLWEGEATFTNLELKLDVLEEELQLPFSILSGHIHQLAITVPWTHLTSEPIVIAIKTVECVIAPKGARNNVDPKSKVSETQSSSSAPKKGVRRKQKPREPDAPPSYLSFMINKIVNNISFACSNLILKYVDEELVLSVNAKNVSVQSANEKWKPTFVDCLPHSLMVRKLVELRGLTICLDRMSPSGRVESFLEPILYHTSVEAHVVHTYKHGSSKKASCTRVDVRCPSLEVSVSVKQIPLLMSLVALANTLHKSRAERQADERKSESSRSTSSSEVAEEKPPESWAAWAWKYVPSFLPSEDDADVHEDFVCLKNTFQFGLYVDHISLSFKTWECSDDKNFYSSMKISTSSFLDLHLRGCFADVVMQGLAWLNFQMGISSLTLQPFGSCFCGADEKCRHATHTMEELAYFYSGKVTQSFLNESLFDISSPENRNVKKIYNTDWEIHVAEVTSSSMMLRSPVVAVDYVHSVNVGDDLTSDALSELGRDLENSDLPEKMLCRVVVGRFVFRVTAGLLHRVQALKTAAEAYYRPPNSPPPTSEEPVAAPRKPDEYKEIGVYIPKSVFTIEIVKPVLEIHMSTHQKTELEAAALFLRKKKMSRQRDACHLCDKVPKLVVSLEVISIRRNQPIYHKRLVISASNKERSSKYLFDECHSTMEANFENMEVFLSTDRERRKIMFPAQICVVQKTLLLPEYWYDVSTVCSTSTIKINNMFLTSTKASAILVKHILNSHIHSTTVTDLLKNSALLVNSSKDERFGHLEIAIDGIEYEARTTSIVSAKTLTIGTSKVCLLQDTENGDQGKNTLVLSGTKGDTEHDPQLHVIFQISRDPVNSGCPTLLLFKCKKISAYIDPDLSDWLRYEPRSSGNQEETSKAPSSNARQKRAGHFRLFSSPELETSPAGDISSQVGNDTCSDLIKRETLTTNSNNEDNAKKVNASKSDAFSVWFPVWDRAVLVGDIESCHVYFPNRRISSYGEQSVEEAVKNCLKDEGNLSIATLTLPYVTLRSANLRQTINQLDALPVHLERNVWAKEKRSFPWSLTFSELSITTVHMKKTLYFLKPVFATFTVSVDPNLRNGHTLELLTLHVNIDVAPVVIKVSALQAEMMAKIIDSLKRALSSFSAPADRHDIYCTYKKEEEQRSSENKNRDYAEDVHIAGMSSNSSPPLDSSVEMAITVELKIAKFSVTFYASVLEEPQFKLSFDVDQLQISAVLQGSCIQTRLTLASSYIRHFSADGGKWEPGNFAGFLMEGRHDSLQVGNFLDITFTRLPSEYVRSQRNSKEMPKLADMLAEDSTRRHSGASPFISEFIIKLQGLDFIFYTDAIAGVIQVVGLLKYLSKHQSKPVNYRESNLSYSKPTSEKTSRPLVYIYAGKMRFLVPVSDAIGVLSAHDTFVLEVRQVRVSSEASSGPEDRQYHMDVNGLAVTTCYWKDLWLKFATIALTTYTSTKRKTTFTESDVIPPIIDSLPIISAVDVFATASFTNDHALVCGQSLEVEVRPEIHVAFNIEQVVLASALCSELAVFFEPLQTEDNRTSEAESGVNLKFSAASPENENVIGSSSAESVSSTTSSVNMLLLAMEVADTEKIQPRLRLLSQIVTDHSSDSRSDRTASHDSLCSHQVENESAEKIFQGTEDEVMPGDMSVRCLSISLTFYECKRNVDEFISKMKFECIKNFLERHNLGVFHRTHIVKYTPRQSEDENMEDIDEEYIPLLNILILSPHVSVTCQLNERKFRIGFYDLSVRTSHIPTSISTAVPTARDFSIILLETKPTADNTDCAPHSPFLDITWSQNTTRPLALSIMCGCPTKVHLSKFRVLSLKGLKSRITSGIYALRSDVSHGDKFVLSSESSEDIHTRLSQFLVHPADERDSERPSSFCGADGGSKLLDTLLGTCIFRADLRQFVVSFETTSESHITVSIANVNADGNFDSKEHTDSFELSIMFKQLMASTFKDGIGHLLLNPWTSTVSLKIFWEDWLLPSDPPNIRISFISDCLCLNLCPIHVICVTDVLHDLKDVSDASTEIEKDVPRSNSCSVPNSRKFDSSIGQHYDDSLGAGAFQLVDGTSGVQERPPEAFQVIFRENPPVLSWGYPQPRAVTGFGVLPALFKVEDHVCNRFPTQQLSCALEYWSECRNSFVHYKSFNICESEKIRFKLPLEIPPVVANAWRIRIMSSSEDVSGDNENNRDEAAKLSAKSLAASLNVESHFTPRFVANVMFYVSIQSLRLRCWSYISHFTVAKQLPAVLESFTCDNLFPQTHCFATVHILGFTSSIASWSAGGSLLESSGNFRVDVVDYASLTEECVGKLKDWKLLLKRNENYEISLNTKPLHIRLSPATIQTLMVSARLWAQTLEDLSRLGGNRKSSPVVFGRYIICNDTTTPMRFRQHGTDEKILLEPKYCHFYSWRSQLRPALLDVSIKIVSWIWGSAVEIDTDGNKISEFRKANIHLLVSITPLSAVQKMVVFTGHVQFYNVLVQQLSCKIEHGNKILPRNEDHLEVRGQAASTSIILDVTRKVSARLAFHGQQHKWSGEIPIDQSKGSGEPWLVEVPVDEDGEYVSVWCRVVRQKMCQTEKILVVISPLYMICSDLCSPVEALVETRALQTAFTAHIEGKGQMQQVDCPGTAGDTHTFTFVPDSFSDARIQVSASYSMIDHQKIFKIPAGEETDIQSIIDKLRSVSNSSWPYVHEDYSLTQWSSCGQPFFNFEVTIQCLDPYCSTLVVCLKPSVLIVNSLGVDINLVIAGTNQVCKISNVGVAVPPDLNRPFYFVIGVEDQHCQSQVLTLGNGMIGSVIPVEGSIEIRLRNHTRCIFMIMTSYVQKHMQVWHLQPKYVVCNFTQVELGLSQLAVRDVKQISRSALHHLLEKFKVVKPATKEQYNLYGQPMLEWQLCQDAKDNYELVIAFRKGNQRSCPIKLVDETSRKCFTIPSYCSSDEQDPADYQPYVLTTVSHADRFYICVRDDPNVDFLICNLCSFTLAVTEEGFEESDCADCWSVAAPGKANYFTLPSNSDRFPQIVNSSNNSLKLKLGKMDFLHTKKPVWSNCVKFGNESEEIVAIPEEGDVILQTRKFGYTRRIIVRNLDGGDVLRINHIKKHSVHFNAPSVDTPVCELAESVEADDNVRELVTTPKKIKRSKKFIRDESSMQQLYRYSMVCDSVVERNSSDVKISVYIKEIKFCLTGCHTPLPTEKFDDVALLASDICVDIEKVQGNDAKQLSILVGDMRLFNLMSLREHVDFPVVIVSQEKPTYGIIDVYMEHASEDLVKLVRENPLIRLAFVVETCANTIMVTACEVNVHPLRIYIEDKFVSKLPVLASYFIPGNMLFTPKLTKNTEEWDTVSEETVPVPLQVRNASEAIAYPLRLDQLVIRAASLQLSIRSSRFIYFALDRAPLMFSEFVGKNLFTTYYILGENLAFHYFFGILLGVGWMVGSLELLGSPTGLARTVCSGLRDFVTLPYEGIFNGPWDFFSGIASGSASLLTSVSAGTVSSVTKLASSFSRNLDILSLDEEHITRQEVIRRSTPSGFCAALRVGMSALAMSLVSAFEGIASQPLRFITYDTRSSRGFISGVGHGVVGVLTKPLSGAAQLVALAGEGFLKQAGWNEIPCVSHIAARDRRSRYSNGLLKYQWIFLPGTPFGKHQIFFVSDATLVTPDGAENAVALVLTFHNLVIVDLTSDSIQQVLETRQVSVGKSADTNVLWLSRDSITEERASENVETISKEFGSDVFHSTSPSDCSVSELSLTFYIDRASKECLCSLLEIIKCQCEGRGFSVL